MGSIFEDNSTNRHKNPYFLALFDGFSSPVPACMFTDISESTFAFLCLSLREIFALCMLWTWLK